MSERLHYFTEASTPVAFDCSDSDIESDLDDSRRPVSESDRAKEHARQFQLWSDEARRRRRSTLPSPSPPSRTPADRQQSNLSERTRLTSSPHIHHSSHPHHPHTHHSHVPGHQRRVSRSHSAKNLRIRLTPSSSSRSLVSDIESEQGLPPSLPQSPANATLSSPGQLTERLPPLDRSTHISIPTLSSPTPILPMSPATLPAEDWEAVGNLNLHDTVDDEPNDECSVHASNTTSSHYEPEPTRRRRLGRLIGGRVQRVSTAAVDTRPTTEQAPRTSLVRRLSVSRTVKRFSLRRMLGL